MEQLRGVDIKHKLKEVPKHKLELVIILENIQYARNVAEFFRTADAAKVNQIILTGVSQRPPFGKDLQKASRSKEKSVEWVYSAEAGDAITALKKQGYQIVALEIADEAVPAQDYILNLPAGTTKIAIVAGSEMFGISPRTLQLVDKAVFIPMFGKGASLNVSASLAIFIYNLIMFAK